MPHIHTEPGQADFVVNVYIVYQNKVLLRLHEKHHLWLSVGGHIELDETPEEAATREVKEEVGLDVKLWTGNKAVFPTGFQDEEYRELTPPLFMNVHKINNEHRHVSLAYFVQAESDQIVEPDNHEKSGGCRWLTREELLADPEIDPATKFYATKALELLGK